MAYNAKKTEHAGPKKGTGAFYGRKAAAKKASNRRRRENDKRLVLQWQIINVSDRKTAEPVVFSASLGR